MASVSPFRKRHDALKEVENDREKLFEELLEECENLGKTLEDTQLQLEREKDVSNLYHQRYKVIELAQKKLKQDLECNAFVSVLIDGDSMNFKDELIQQGESGGQEASRILVSAVNEYIRGGSLGLRSDLAIVIRIYANLKGLARTYKDAKVLADGNDLEQFVRGFNKGHPLADIADAGQGKECSDEKIRETFKLQMGNLQCKHVIFAGPTDNGYARLLGPYSGTELDGQRITMLEGPPFERELAQLKDKFHTTSFPAVFRTTKLESRRVSFSKTATPPPSASALKPTVPSGAATISLNKDITPSANQTMNNAANQIGPSSNGFGPGQPVSMPELGVHRNSKGQRVDPPLKVSSTLVYNLKPRKLCNTFHLLGSCHNNYCIHEHGEKLSAKETEALRAIARMAPCKSKLECEDEECYSGHRCPNKPCVWNECQFSKEMHNVDTKLVAKY